MWSHSEDWNYAHFFSPVNVIPTFMHVYYEAGQLKISCACQHIWAEYAQWWGNFSWFAWRLTSSSCNPLTLGKRSPLPTLLSPCQIYTQIHFQVAGLHTDRHCVYFVQYKNWKKKLHMKTWKAWADMSPVGSVAWLARKQLIPNVGFSFFFILWFNSGQKLGSCSMPTLEADKW